MRTSKSISFSFSLAFSLVLILILMAKTTHAVPAPVRRTINSEYAEMRKIVLGAPGGKRNPDWILGFYGDDVYLNEDDRKVFDKNLDLTVGHCRDDCSGAFSKGIYSLLKDYKVRGVKHGKNMVIVKVMLEIGNNAWGEVKALKDAGLYVDSGLANVGKGDHPVIVIKVIEGVIINETIEYKNAKLDQRLKFLEEAKPHIKEGVVHFAVQKGFLHVDLNPANFLVGGRQTSKGLVLKTPMTEARLVDWGYQA